MNSKFIKNFSIEGQLSNLPDSDYWLSREESILTYLHQRGASVPKVQMKDLVRKSLTLQNVGISLDVFFTSNDYPAINKNSALRLFLGAILLLEELFSLGVLHLDIALRNIATPNPHGQDIYILDFIHALSSHSSLQKPLPLLPTTGLHHSSLIDALNIDWENYFKYLGKETPKLDKTLSISNEEFSKYWIDQPVVQSLSEYHPILSHGIGNLASEMAASKNIDDSTREIFAGFSNTLKNLGPQDSYLLLSDTKSHIVTILGSDSTNDFLYTNATPIPKVHSSCIEISKPAIPHVIEPTPVNSTGNIAAHDGLIVNGKNLQSLTDPIKIESLQIASPFSFGNFLMSWALILVNIYLIDFVVRHRKIILTDEVILLIILIGVTAPIGVFLGLFSGGTKRTKLLSFSALLAVATELIVIGSYPNAAYASFLSWLPSCVIAFFALVLSLSSKKP